VTFFAPTIPEFVLAENNNSGISTAAKLNQITNAYPKGHIRKDAPYREKPF